MGADVFGAEQGGSVCLYLVEGLWGVSSGGNSLQVVDVGNDTNHWEVFGRIPPQGGPQADRETTF